MARNMFLLTCVNEEYFLAGAPSLHPSKEAAEAAMKAEVDGTVEMFLSEGWEEEYIAREDGPKSSVRCGESEYYWEVSEIEIPD